MMTITRKWRSNDDNGLNDNDNRYTLFQLVRDDDVDHEKKMISKMTTKAEIMMLSMIDKDKLMDGGRATYFLNHHDPRSRCESHRCRQS